MAGSYLVIASFSNTELLKTAISELKESRAQRPLSLKLYMPFPAHELMEAVGDEKRSPIRFFVFAGAMVGCLGAFLFTSWMSLDYPLRTGAKPILSFPAFVIIAFECTVLLAVIFTILSLFHWARIPNISFTPDYRPEFGEGTFGLVVRAKKTEVEGLREKLAAYGAEKVEVEYVR